MNGFSAEKFSEHQVRCDFSWLDPGDGALIQVLHSGEKGLLVEGTLKGIPKGVVKLGACCGFSPKRGELLVICFPSSLFGHFSF